MNEDLKYNSIPFFSVNLGISQLNMIGNFTDYEKVKERELFYEFSKNGHIIGAATKKNFNELMILREVMMKNVLPEGISYEEIKNKIK